MESFHCYDNSDVIATLMVAVFPNVCLWRRSLCSDLVLTLKNCIEPPSYAWTAYVVAIWPSVLFDSFVKIWATCEMFLGKWFTATPGKTIPVRDDSQERFLAQHSVALLEQCWNHSKQCPNSVATMCCSKKSLLQIISCNHLNNKVFLNEVHIEKLLSFRVFVRAIRSRVRGLIECFRWWCSHQQRKWQTSSVTNERH